MGIEQYLQQILSARYGKDVRQSIHDSIYEINEVAKKAEYDASTAPESAKAYAQAALASEQAAEDYKTAAEQAAQQAMSGTPEGYADLVAKVNSIYRQTATSYNVVGTSEGSALAHTIYGMSVQDGTPTPSVPVEIQSAKADFRCVGKNLIPYPPYNDGNSKTNNGITFTVNSDGTVTANGTATAAATYNCIIRLPSGIHKKFPNGRYHASGCPSGGLGNTYRMFFNHTVNGAISDYLEDRGNGGTFTVNGDDFYDDGALIGVQIYISSGYTANNLVFKPMITLADVEDSDYEHYEPYQHTDVTTDITLRAIEVASSVEHNLERDGKYYVADTVDWSEDEGYQITRRVGTFELDGNVSGFGINGSGTNRRFVLQYVNSLNIGVSKYNAVSMSDRFILETTNSSTWGHYRIGSDGYLILHDNASAMADVDTLKTWLGTNKPRFDYALATPITESITSEQAQALLSLKTYDEATSISATGDIEPSLDLEYSKDRNTALALTGHNLAHKNAFKLNDINTALIELGGN